METRLFGGGFNKLAKLFIRDVELIAKDPHGKYSVDARILGDNDEEIARNKQHYKNVGVNQLSQDISKLCNQDIVVKQGNLDDINPIESFIFWVKAYNSSKNMLTTQESSVLKIIRPLAIIQDGENRPYIIMPKLEGTLALNFKDLPTKLLEFFEMSKEVMDNFEEELEKRGRFIVRNIDVQFWYLSEKLRNRGLDMGTDVWAKNAMIDENGVVTIFDLIPKQKNS